MKKYLIILFAALIILPACKYDEGPFISIYSKKERIMGNKTFKSVIVNGEDKTSSYSLQAFDFGKTGGYMWNFYDATGYGYQKSYPGTWELIDDKEIIVMETIEPDTIYTHSWKIKRLTYADMHLERIDEDGNLIRWELYQAY